MTSALHDDDDYYANPHLEEPAAAAPGEPQPVYGSVLEFVDAQIAPVYRRMVADTPHRRWCPRWFDHTEAVLRLEALWRSWEYLRLDPATGMSVWWKDHADHHMPMLFDPEGPFRSCDATKGHNYMAAIAPLPTDLRRLTAVLTPSEEGTSDV